MHVSPSASLYSTNNHAPSERLCCSRTMADQACAALIAKAAALGIPLPDASRWTVEIVSLAGNRSLHMRQTGDGQILVMADGWAFRSVTTPEGGRQITDIFLPGDIIDSIVGGGNPIEHEVSACGPATIAALRHAPVGNEISFEQIVEWSRQEETATLRSRLVSLGRRDARARIAHLIVELARRLDRVGLVQDGMFRCPLTQEQFADVLGLTPVHTNRMFQALRADGLASFDRPFVVIKSLQRLADVAGVSDHLESEPRFSACVGRSTRSRWG